MRKATSQRKVSIEEHREMGALISLALLCLDCTRDKQIGAKLHDKAIKIHNLIGELKCGLEDLMYQEGAPATIEFNQIYYPGGGTHALRTVSGLETLHYNWASVPVRWLVNHQEFWRAVEFYAEYDQPGQGVPHA